MRSSSSVVTPGATALPASASAPAAIRPGDPHLGDHLGVCTHGSVPSCTVDFQAYSGRGIELGTGSVGDRSPGRRAVRTGMSASLIVGSPTPRHVSRRSMRHRCAPGAGSDPPWRSQSSSAIRTDAIASGADQPRARVVGAQVGYPRRHQLGDGRLVADVDLQRPRVQHRRRSGHDREVTHLIADVAEVVAERMERTDDGVAGGQFGRLSRELRR